MSEWMPILAGCCLSGFTLLVRGMKTRIATATAGILLLAVTATVVSGEYRTSWAYLFADVAQVVAGFVAVLLGARWIERAAQRHERR